jgi:hypothetical protein
MMNKFIISIIILNFCLFLINAVPFFKNPKNCKTTHSESNVWGNTATTTYDFEYKIFDIESITIYYWNVIQGMDIHLKDGMIEYFGDKYFPNTRIKYLSNEIYLKKKKIVKVTGNYDNLINRIRFMILDVATNTTSWTYLFGYNQGGISSSVESNLPNYRLTKIYGKIGTYGSGKAFQNLKFGYSYSKCK